MQYGGFDIFRGTNRHDFAISKGNFIKIYSKNQPQSSCAGLNAHILALSNQYARNRVLLETTNAPQPY